MKIISRKCIVTGEIVSIDKLFRFVLTKNKEIKLEKDSKILGRGAYCKREKDVLDLLFKKHLLNKAFKRNIPNDIYEALKKEVDEYVKKK